MDEKAVRDALDRASAIATDAALTMVVVRLLLPFSLIGRIPTSEEMSVGLAQAFDAFGPDAPPEVGERVRAICFAVIDEARGLRRREKKRR